MTDNRKEGAEKDMALFGRKRNIYRFDFSSTKEYFEKNRSTDEKNFLRCPEWVLPEFDEDGDYVEEPDGFLPLFDHELQRRFFTEGEMAAGAIVQANELLFSRGKDDCAAAFIYTAEPHFIQHPGELISLAEAIFETKGDSGYMPSIQRLADLLADEYERIFRYRLPRDLMENREVYFTSIFVDRRHLPEKKLVPETVYPMIVLPDSRPDAMIMPYWYWKEKK